MARLGETLAARRRAGKGSVVAYLMGGSVPPERFLSAVDALQAAGIAGLEVGFPFSDPMAEGPVIQRAASDALAAHTHFEDVLGLLRTASYKLPIALMTYLNPILQRGPERVLRDIQEAGGSALILPDLPVEAAAPFHQGRSRTHVDTVLLASPATTQPRLGRIVRSTEGFLYIVSRYGTTGLGAGKATPGQAAPPDLSGLISSARALRPQMPLMVGFGISRPDDVKRYLGSGADGVIVGSVFQDLLTQGAPASALGDLAHSLVRAAEDRDRQGT